MMRLKIRRHSIASPIEGALILVMIFVIASILWPIYVSARPKMQAKACAENMKQLSQAMSLYGVDWDDHRPIAELWSDSITKYLDHRVSIESVSHCPAASSEYSYAFNNNMSCMGLKAIKKPEEIVQLFEADVSIPNATGGSGLLPAKWRHMRRINVGFADGHIKLTELANQLRWQP